MAATIRLTGASGYMGSGGALTDASTWRTGAGPPTVGPTRLDEASAAAAPGKPA